MLVGTALPPTAGAQQSDEEGISLIALSVTSDVAQTHMYPAFHPDETRYDVAAPSEGDRVTVNAVAPPGEDVIWTGDDADPNLPGFQLVLTAGASTWISVAVNTFDLDAPLKFYGVSVSRASSEPKGWRVYHDVRVETMVDDASLRSHYLHGVWADSSRVLTSGGRFHSELTGDERFDEKLFAFNASDGSRRLADEFVLGGRPSEGIWSDGTTLWAMDWDGDLRAYDLSDGSLIANKGFGVRPSSFRYDENGNYVKYTDNPSPRGIWSDGETVWIVDPDRGKVLAYVLDGGSCSSWDFCRQSDKDFDLAGDNGSPWGITAGKSTANGDVDTWWVSDVDDDKLYAYNRSDGSRNASLDFDTLKSAGVTMPLGLHATDAIMYVVDFIENSVFAFSMPYVSGPIGPALVSSDATLSSLSLSNATLSPAPFDSAHTLYTAQVDNDVTSTTITAIPNHSLATAVVLDGSTAAEGGVVHLDQVGPDSVNTFTVRVTAQDGFTRQDYTVGVERRALSTDATLSGLTLTGVPPQELGFSSTKFDYALTVSSSLDETIVKATPSDARVKSLVYKLDGQVVDADSNVDVDGDGIGDFVMPLAVGANEITVEVSAEVGVATETYTVRLTRERPLSDNAMLEKLALMYGDEEAQMTPGFASDVYTYRTTVAHGVSSVLVKYELRDTNAKSVEILIGGAKDNNGVVADEGLVTQETGVVPSAGLIVGENTLTVRVTAENGSDTHEYEVTITRAVASNVATLESLSLDPGELMRQGDVGGFAPEVVLYTASLLHGDATTGLSLVKTNGTATVDVRHGGTVGQNDAVTGGTSVTGIVDATDSNTWNYDIPLPAPTESEASETVVTIQVTAQDTVTTNLYVVTVTRPVEPDSSDATLGTLVLTNPKNLRDVEFDSAFASGDTYYTADVGNDVTQIVVKAKPTSNADATTVELKLADVSLGNKASLDPDTGGVTVTLGEPNVANVLTIKVTAEDGNATELYTVVVTRSLPPLPGVATLAELVLKDVAQAELTLDPVFNEGDEPGQNPHATSVDNGVTKVHVTARRTDPDATVEVMVGGSVDLNGMIKGQTDADSFGFVPLAVAGGDNTVRVVVTAQNGDKLTYVLTVTRAAAPASNVATLSSLTVSDADFTFVSDTLSYTVGVGNGVTSTTVRAIATSEAASLTVTLGTATATATTSDVKLTAPLVPGANEIVVVVTAENGTEGEPYTVTVNRAAPSRPAGNTNPGTSRPGTSNTGVGFFTPGGGSSTPGGGTETDTSEDESDSSDSESDTSSPYTDAGDGGSEQEDAINALYGLGVLTGTECEENRICPNDELTRWLAAVWLVRVLDGEEPPAITESRFADVNASPMWEDSMWFAPHVERLAELEVTVGCSVTAPARYCPDEGLSRAQVASWLVRAFDLSSAASAGFTDTVDNTHEADIDSVVAAGIMSGCSTNPNSFCPDTVVTRGELALYVDRARKLSSDA